MVFQNYALYPHMTVRENMGFALKLAKVTKSEIDKKVDEAAEILELGSHLDRKPANLSGGQRQRVAMGRAIVRDPKAFLMDEPLSNLDAKLRVQMRTQVARIQNQLGTTMLYVTHDQTEAMTLGDRVAVMRAGIIQQVDTPKVLYEDPVNLFVAGFIGSPAMNFIPARLEEGKVRLPFGDAPIPRGRDDQEARRDRRHPPRALRGRRSSATTSPTACASRPTSTSSSRWAPSSTPTSTSRARRRSTPSSSTSSPPTPAWTTSRAAAPRTSSRASTPAARPSTAARSSSSSTPRRSSSSTPTAGAR